MKLLFFPVLFLSASALDCSEASRWLPTIYATANTQVVHNQNLYSNSWYAAATDIPGASGTWKLLGACDAGTEPTDGEDCSGTAAWTPQIYTAATLVTHEGIKYINQYYAGPSDVPGRSGAWLAEAYCSTSQGGTSLPITSPLRPTAAPIVTTVRPPVVAATTVTSRATSKPTAPFVQPPTTRPVVAGDGVDCTGVYKWHPDATYSAAGQKVTFQHGLYSNKWWTSGVAPSAGEEWSYLGACITGTDSLAYAPGVGISTENEKLLCSCCKQCAKVTGSTPVCLDDTTSESACYYTWCPNYNTFDEATCAQVIEDGKLGWYSGAMAEGKPIPDRAFMPYVDVTLAKVANFTTVMQNYGATHFILAFVVSGSGCQGSWGGAYDVGSGPMLSGNVPLYEEINRLREAGGDVVVSFGGANGVELADNTACQTGDAVANLKKVYSGVLDMLKLKVLDFDIEGQAVDIGKRSTGWKYRFAAVKELAAERPDLHLWWTLPVLPTGLIASGMAFIEDLMTAGVRLDRLNLMTMDYGAAACTGTMHECEVAALTSVAEQVYSTATKLGVAASYGFSSVEDVYPHLGSTPMIGVNDVATEIYSLENARESLAVWKSTKPLGLLSMWSLARDSPCAGNAADPSCSSGNVQTKDYEFTQIYAGYPN